MATGVTIKNDKLTKLAKGTELRAAVHKEILTTALEIETEIKQNAPHDKGTLRQSYHTEFHGATVRAEFKLSENPKSEDEVLVGSNLRYAGIREREGGIAAPANVVADAFKNKTDGLVQRVSKIVGEYLQK